MCEHRWQTVKPRLEQSSGFGGVGNEIPPFYFRKVSDAFAKEGCPGCLKYKALCESTAFFL